ncbi:MAG: autotransporter-associated beta strand repeat-containing protein [Bacteroidetes bacterium]|jgi:uncharacterized repeat protein (TIGR03803 family)|nr:autotransporter-associated beta strand repeat-containing protein [Bacteroidota bacterium]
MKQLTFLFLFLSTIVSKAQYTKLLDFDYSVNGGRPVGSLVSDGVFLYGMTSEGGSYNYGTIFKIKPDGSNYLKLYDFSGTADGKGPEGTLLIRGSELFGMTKFGGINNSGVAFKIMSDGTNFVKLRDFGTNPDGFNPSGGFYDDGIFLYGMTMFGGTNSQGTIFKIMPDGSGYSRILNFTGISNGRIPKGELISDGTFLYGLTREGGVNGDGTIFKIKPDGTGYLKIFEFEDYLTGRWPGGSLVTDGNYFYGLTENGGINTVGTIFKIKMDGTDFVKLHDFGFSPDPTNPLGSLIYDGTDLYGLSKWGGLNSFGVVFRIKPDGSDFTTVFNLDENVTGSNPYGSLISDGHYLYGTARNGGSNSVGTVFKVCKIPNATIQSLRICPGSFVTIGTHTYSSSGIYIDTLSSILGCGDSIVTTNVTLVPAFYSTAYDSTSNTFTLTVDSATTATAISYLWDFGDGNISTLNSPIHNYQVDSLYNVCMTIYSGLGDTCTYCHTIGKDTSGNIIRNTGFSLNVQNGSIVTSIQGTNRESNTPRVFPNPSDGLLMIDSETKILELKIRNLLGETLYTEMSNSNFVQIDIRNQPNGVYFLSIKTAAGTFARKVLISN